MSSKLAYGREHVVDGATHLQNGNCDRHKNCAPSKNQLDSYVRAYQGECDRGVGVLARVFVLKLDFAPNNVKLKCKLKLRLKYLLQKASIGFFLMHRFS